LKVFTKSWIVGNHIGRDVNTLSCAVTVVNIFRHFLLTLHISMWMLP